MCDIDWHTLLEYIKVLLSWPPVALIIVLILTTRFRSSIKDFLDRIVEGNIFGQTIKAAPPSQTTGPTGATKDKLAIAGEAATQHNAPQATQVNDALPPELAGDPGAQAALAFVKANPAQTVVEYKRLLLSYNSERLFMRIFGTQIALLEFLASRADSPPVPLASLIQFHDEHQKKVGNTEYQLRDYVNFLVTFGVVAITGEEGNYEYKITQHGAEFLSYIKANYPTGWNQRPY